MSEQIEVVEGQTLARTILEALDQGRTPDWNALNRTYRDPLLCVAAARLRSLDLHRQFTPEDVMHDFLVRRVYPPRQARTMFAPSAEGERPLRNRLLTSLGNFCTDLTRTPRAGRVRGDHEDLLANTPARPDNLAPDFEEVENLLHQQITAIRVACPLRRRPRGAAYREALLLRNRLDLAVGFDGIELRSERDGRPVTLDLSMLEHLTAWETEEGTMTLVEGGVSLEQLWEQVRAIVLNSPVRHVSIDRFAPLIPVSRDLWDQWISRGRRMIQARLGAGYSQVFALWNNQREGA